MLNIQAEDVERVACMLHELLRGDLNHDSPYRLQAYKELADDIKEANRQQVLRAPKLLAMLGYRVERDDEAKQGLSVHLTEAEIEQASEAEHRGWMRQKIAAGYRYGAVRDDVKRLHPSLVSWEQLPNSVRELDRQRVRLMPWIVRELGLRVKR